MTATVAGGVGGGFGLLILVAIVAVGVLVLRKLAGKGRRVHCYGLGGGGGGLCFAVMLCACTPRSLGAAICFYFIKKSNLISFHIILCMNVWM